MDRDGEALIRHYATAGAVKNGILDMRGTNQKERENEKEFASPINVIVRRSRNVHLQQQVMTFFIFELLPEIAILVEAFRESHRKVSYPEIVKHASLQGDALRKMRRKGNPHGRTRAASLQEGITRTWRSSNQLHNPSERDMERHSTGRNRYTLWNKTRGDRMAPTEA